MSGDRRRKGRGASAKRRYRQVRRTEAMEERRSRIFRAAWELLGERRYHDVTIASVAERAGVSQRTVFRLIGPKDRLLEAWMEAIAQDKAATREGRIDLLPWGIRLGWQRWMAEPGRKPYAPGDVEGFVQGLDRFYEEWGDMLINLYEQERDVPQFAPFLRYPRRRHRDNVRYLLGRLVRGSDGERRLRLEMLSAATDVQLWKVLRRDRGLPRAETRAVILRLVRDLTGSTPEDTS